MRKNITYEKVNKLVWLFLILASICGLIGIPVGALLLESWTIFLVGIILGFIFYFTFGYFYNLMSVNDWCDSCRRILPNPNYYKYDCPYCGTEYI